MHILCFHTCLDYGSGSWQVVVKDFHISFLGEVPVEVSKSGDKDIEACGATWYVLLHRDTQPLDAA